MPKSKLKRLRTPLVAIAVASTLVSLFSYSAFFSAQTAVLVPPPMIVQSAPNSSYVQLHGVSGENNSFILVLDSGNHVFSENLTMALSITEKGGGACTAWLSVDCDGFSNEVSVDGRIVDGNLVIDSRKSIFLVNPDLSRRHIVLTETDEWELPAVVSSKMMKFSTAVDPYRVTAVKVSSAATRTEKGWPFSVDVGYDPNTGILIYSGFSLSDVLLDKLGIDLLLGGNLELVSYSENLNLEVVNSPTPGLMVLVPFVLFILLISSPVIVTVVYVLRKRRKRTQTGAHNVPESSNNSTKNCDRKSW
ncbi:MAG: hypothetical protein PVH73_04245 [Candidatus Bathyarchaeota archaeon]